MSVWGRGNEGGIAAVNSRGFSSVKVEEVCAQDVAAFLVSKACLGERDRRDDLRLRLAAIPAAIAGKVQLS